MTPATLVTIALGVLPFLTGYLSYRLSARSAHEQAQAARNAVDAMAYQRAREIYDGAITNLRADVDRMRKELAEARTAAARSGALRMELADRDRTIEMMRRDVDSLRRRLAREQGDEA